MTRLSTILSLLALGCLSCADRPNLLIQIQRSAHIEADTLESPFQIEVLDGEGRPLESREISPALLSERQRLFEGLNLEEGDTYRIRLTAPLPQICPGPRSRLLGVSPPFSYTRALTEINIYVDCEDGSSPTLNKPKETRYLNTSTFLPTPYPYGQVLIVGGAEPTSFSWEKPKETKILSTIETYDPRAGLFREHAATLIDPVLMHQATAINPAQLLITGGLQLVETAASELEFLVSDQVRLIDGDQEPTLQSELHTPRTFHTSVLLQDGSLFIAGGGGAFLLNLMRPTERYDPTGVVASQELPSLSIGRFAPAVVPFPDGRQILVAGGAYNKDTDVPMDLYCLSDPCPCGAAPCVEQLEGFGPDRGRALVTGTLVPCDSGGTGAIYLVGGGHDNENKTDYVIDPEIYCLDTAAPDKLQQVGLLRQARTAHTTTLVGDSEERYRLLVAGGLVNKTEALNSAEIFPVSCRCDLITAEAMEEITLMGARRTHTATPLADGTILIFDGPNSDAERVNPAR